MANSFDVQVASPFQSLLAGEQGYADARKRGLEQQKRQVTQEAAQLWQAGDKQGAFARLLQGEQYDAANAYGTIDQRQTTNARNDRLDARQLTRDAADDKYRAAQLAIQQRTANRLDSAGPVQSAQQRAQAASQYGLQPGSQEFKQYVLTGELPSAGTTNVQAQFDQRKTAAAQAGLTPDHPAYQGFLLTGKMPREDAQPLTATDKKAILEADDGVLAAQTAIDSLNKAKQLSPKAFGFKGAGNIAAVGALLGNETSIATAELDNTVTSNALSQLKAIFGGAPTEGERKILLDIQGASSQPDAVRQRIYDRAIQMAQNRLRFNEQRAADMRGGQFYKPQGSMNRAPVQQTQGITQEQYNALPSGSVFTAPDGTQRVKP